MSLFDTYDDFKIRIKTLNNMGFMLGHWGSPDWYTEYEKNLQSEENKQTEVRKEIEEIAKNLFED